MVSTLGFYNSNGGASKANRQPGKSAMSAVFILEQVFTDDLGSCQEGLRPSDLLSTEERLALLSVATLVSYYGNGEHILDLNQFREQFVSVGATDVLQWCALAIGGQCGFRSFQDENYDQIVVAIRNLSSKGYLEFSQLGYVFIPFCLMPHAEHCGSCSPICAWKNERRIAYVRRCNASSSRSGDEKPRTKTGANHLRLAHPVAEAHPDDKKLVAAGPPVAVARRWMDGFMDQELQAGRKTDRDRAAALCAEATGVPWKLCREAYREAANAIGIRRGRRPRNLENMENSESPTPNSPK